MRWRAGTGGGERRVSYDYDISYSIYGWWNCPLVVSGAGGQCLLKYGLRVFPVRRMVNYDAIIAAGRSNGRDRAGCAL